MLITNTLQHCISDLKAWKSGMVSKELHVNTKKTKFLVFGVGFDIPRKSGQARLCCLLHWSRQSLHCVLAVQAEGPPSLVDFPLAADQRMSMAPRVMWTATFCYLGDMLCSGWSWASAIFAKWCETWIQFRKFWLVLTPSQFSPNVCSKVCGIYIHFGMLQGSELWGPNASDVRGTDFASTRA